jgi:hypothetical protein
MKTSTDTTVSAVRHSGPYAFITSNADIILLSNTPLIDDKIQASNS